MATEWAGWMAKGWRRTASEKEGRNEAIRGAPATCIADREQHEQAVQTESDWGKSSKNQAGGKCFIFKISVQK